MKKLKKMCKYKSGDFDDLEGFISEEMTAPQYICRKCLRVSRDKKLLCKPEKMK